MEVLGKAVRPRRNMEGEGFWSEGKWILYKKRSTAWGGVDMAAICVGIVQNPPGCAEMFEVV